MEIIVTDETDERFVEFCKSFGCFLDDPQVVLLLVSFKKTVGCASFRVYDSQSAEITTLFLNSYDEREKIAYKLIRQLEKMKAFESSHTMYRHVFSNGMIISSSKKENIEYMKDVFDARK